MGWCFGVFLLWVFGFFRKFLKCALSLLRCFCILLWVCDNVLY